MLRTKSALAGTSDGLECNGVDRMKNDEDPEKQIGWRNCPEEAADVERPERDAPAGLQFRLNSRCDQEAAKREEDHDA